MSTSDTINVERFESGVDRDKFDFNPETGELDYRTHHEFLPGDVDPLWKVEHPEYGTFELECSKEDFEERYQEYIEDAEMNDS